MENFTFHSPTKIIFGIGSEAKVGNEVKLNGLGSKVLLHYGGGSIKKTGLYEKVVASLQAAGVEFAELPGVQPNPRLSLVREGIRICRENNLTGIVAVGGGSVIDSSKAISIGVPYEGDVWDFYAGKAAAKTTLPVGAVLTIPAAGSESSKNSVITNEDGWYKRGYGNDLMRPKFAVLNPELTFTLPAYQTACGVVDIMAHVMERYFTNTQDVELTDRLCESTLKTVIHNAPLVLQQPDNYAARAEIMWASTIAHNGLLGTGRLEDWASHAIEHELSAIYDVAHGAGLAVIFPAWMNYVGRQNCRKLAQFAQQVWGVDSYAGGETAIAAEGIAKTREFFKGLGLPVTLQELGINAERLEEMAKKAVKSGTHVGNFVKLDVGNIVEIYRSAL